MNNLNSTHYRNMKQPIRAFARDQVGGLFNPARDNQATQLAFKVKYVPIRATYDDTLDPNAKNYPILDSGLIPFRHMQVMTKDQILQACEENLEYMLTCSGIYRIHWEYNNIPTEIEWNKFSSNYKFRVEFRKTKLAGYESIAIIGSL